ncbi:MAG: tetratricopeptide repeat protein [Candidatus Eremiobacteraeota bacterium]|nr:tetratricopeptide repeat protein [Candidatus Eremiobacteraeota bacterium]
MTRILKGALALFFTCAFAAAIFGGAGSRASAASKSPAATSSPSAEASPVATPEPPDVAIPRLQARLKTTPDDREALTQITGYYLQTGRPDLALGTSQKLMQLGVKTGQVYYFSGYSNMQLGRIPQATADLEQASNLEPTNIAVLGSLADLYVRQGRLADAERIAKRAVTFNKDNKTAYTTYGQVLATEQKYDDARAEFELAAKLDPKDPGPVLLEANTYLKQNAIALASSLYDRALTIDPSSQDALFGKAQILAQQHNVKDADTTYEKLRTLIPDNDGKAAILLEEARLFATEKMDDQAVATYKSAIAQYPAVTATHVAYGDYLASKNDLTGAETEWQTGLGPNRDNREALARLGTYYADKKDFPKAIDYLKRLTEISPNDPRGWTVLGSVYGSQNNWRDAHDAFRHAYDLTHAPDALKMVGQTDLNLRNYKEAQQIFEAIEKNGADYVKQDPSVIYLLAQSYDKQGMCPQAKSAYDRFIPYLKPGTQAYAQVKKESADLRCPKPAAKKTS